MGKFSEYLARSGPYNSPKIVLRYFLGWIIVLLMLLFWGGYLITTTVIDMHDNSDTLRIMDRN